MHKDPTMARRTKLVYICCIAIPALTFYHVFSRRVDQKVTNKVDAMQKISLQSKVLTNGLPDLQEKTVTPSFTEKSKHRILLVTSDGVGPIDVEGIFVSNLDMLYLHDPLSIYAPDRDRNVTKALIQASRSRGYDCVDKPVSCRLDYLFSCQLLLYFNEALFRAPVRDTQDIRAWYKEILVSIRGTLGDDILKIGIDDICKENYSVLAVKVTQVNLIEDVLPLMESGVKVIYILQDPRALVASHPMYYSQNVLSSYAKEICQRYETNLAFLQRASQVTWQHRVLRDNFILVRYEDIVSDKNDMARRLKGFVGIDRLPQGEQQQKIGSVSYVKDFYWRHQLDILKVVQIESMCKQVMYKLGYYPVSYSIKDPTVPVIGQVAQSLPYFIGL